MRRQECGSNAMVTVQMTVEEYLEMKSRQETKEVTTVQNKLHYAVHENTAAEVIYNRVNNEKPFVGMTNFKGN